MESFKLVSSYKPMGDQPEAIDQLVSGIENGLDEQVLLGVTGIPVKLLQWLTLLHVLTDLLWSLHIIRLSQPSCALSLKSFFRKMQ